MYECPECGVKFKQEIFGKQYRNLHDCKQDVAYKASNKVMLGLSIEEGVLPFNTIRNRIACGMRKCFKNNNNTQSYEVLIRELQSRVEDLEHAAQAVVDIAEPMLHKRRIEFAYAVDTKLLDKLAEVLKG